MPGPFVPAMFTADMQTVASTPLPSDPVRVRQKQECLAKWLTMFSYTPELFPPQAAVMNAVVIGDSEALVDLKL